jgi:hypothetical protein
MITKDGRDTPIEKLTAENYVVPRGEERSYHAVIEVKQFDPKTGKRLSTPRIQKFGKKIFESSVRASLKKQGYDIVILHDPNQWIQEQQEKAAEQAKAAAEAKAKAEKEAFDAAVAAAVAKEIAKLKAEEGRKAKADNGTNGAADNGTDDKAEKGKKAEK